MNRPRHAVRQYNYIRPIIIGFTIAAIIIFILYAANVTVKPTTTHTPAPQPTWTTYIPTTPDACRHMVDAADAMYDQANKYGDATLDAASKAAKQQYAAAETAIDKAQTEQKKLAAAQKKYLAQAKACTKT